MQQNQRDDYIYPFQMNELDFENKEDVQEFDNFLGEGTVKDFMHYVNVPMLICNKPGNVLKLKFEGSSVGIAVAAGPDAGIIEYRIDKKEWTTLNLFTKWSKSLHLPWYYTLKTDLLRDEHLLEMRIAKTKDERSTGHACRIRYFYINKHVVR